MRRNRSGSPMRLAASAAASVALLTVALGGCATQPRPSAIEHLSADIHVSRSDPDSIQVAVTNDWVERVTVTGLELDTAQFAAPSRWPKTSTEIGPGATVDLPVGVPPMACDATPGDLEVRLSVAPDDIATLVAPDDEQWLPRIVERACLADAVDAIARIMIAPPRPRLEGSRLVADLDLTVAPTGREGTMTIHALHDTVLLAIVDPGASGTRDRVAVERDIHGDGVPEVITITIVPARCDAHAIAEDKRGTVLMLEVTTPLASGLHAVAAPDDVRGALYRFVTEACAH